MKKQNINWFSTVLRVVICFIILTDLTEFSVEVLCGWSVRWSRRSRCEKKEERQELNLGDAQGTPSKYSRRLKRLSLGMPRKASPLSSSFIGNFTWSYIFIHHMICVLLGASFYSISICFLLFRIIFCTYIFNKNVKDSLCHAYFASIHVAVWKQKVYSCCKNSLEK